MKHHPDTRDITIPSAFCLFVLFLIALTQPLTAQNGFNIPFSQFGVGTVEQPYNIPMITKMGGVAYTLHGNNLVNPINPASYGSIQPESFVFDMGVGIQTSVLRDNNERLFDADGNIGYLLMAMPLTKWWKLGAGLMPYSTVNYESVSRSIDPTYPDTIKTIYDGNGGISQAFIGMAFNILNGSEKKPDIQVGFNVNFLTGNIYRAISNTFMHNDSAHYYLPNRRFKRTTMGNITLDFGLQARQPIGDKYTLGLGLVYKPYMDLTVKDMAIIYTYHANDESLIDTVFPGPDGDPSFNSKVEQANTFGFGLNFERNNRWQVAFDATFASWSGMKYTEGRQPSVFGTSSINYGPFSRYALGFEKKGNMDANTYWGRISWGMGIHRETGVLHLNINNNSQRVDEWGAGLGLTLPMRKGRSLLTLSLGYSSLGNSSILQRNTVTFGIAVSSCERWFFKRKYD